MLKQRLRTFEKFSVERELEVLEDGVDGAVVLGDGSLQGADLPVVGDDDALVLDHEVCELLIEPILVFDVFIIDLSAVELPGEGAVIMPEGENLSPEAFE